MLKCADPGRYGSLTAVPQTGSGQPEQVAGGAGVLGRWALLDSSAHTALTLTSTGRGQALTDKIQYFCLACEDTTAPEPK